MHKLENAPARSSNLASVSLTEQRNSGYLVSPKFFATWNRFLNYGVELQKCIKSTNLHSTCFFSIWNSVIVLHQIGLPDDVVDFFKAVL
jgi:hypothetical protein